MKKLLILITITMAFVFSASTAGAWYISVDPLGDVELAPNDPFTAEIVFHADAGGNTLNSYGFAIGFDSAELSYTGHTHTPPAGVFELFGPSFYRAPDMIDNFAVGAFSGGAAMSGDTVLATASFTATTGIIWDDFDDVFITLSGGAATFMVDMIEVDILGTSFLQQGPDVGQVPIPGAVILLGSGLLGLIGIRRRR
jgi:hypothetical protein